ncbi:MAG TPA: MFS transporter [Actinomycetota bacterium]|nr:MFS transporter [Actinomycetota bacterium]
MRAARDRRSAQGVYLTIEAVTGFAFYTMATLASVYRIQSAGLDPLQLVLVGTALEATTFVFEIPTGILADTISRRRSVIVGTFLTGAGFVIEASFPSFVPILLGQVVWGLGYTFISGANVAWVTDEVGEAPAAGLYLRGAQLANFTSLGGIVASVALGTVSLALPIFVAGIIFGVLGLFLFVAMPETAFRRAPARERPLDAMRTSPGAARRTVRLRPVLVTILVVSALHGASTETFDRLWELHLLQGIGLPSLGPLDPIVWFGVVNAVGLLLGIAAIELVKRRVDVVRGPGVIRALAVVNVALVVATTAFGLTGSFGLALVVFWTVDVLRYTHLPLFQAWVNRGLESATRATINSSVSQMDGLGQIFGGPVLGAVGAVRSVAAAIAAAGLLRVPVLFLLGRKTVLEEPDPQSKEAASS